MNKARLRKKIFAVDEIKWLFENTIKGTFYNPIRYANKYKQTRTGRKYFNNEQGN